VKERLNLKRSDPLLKLIITKIIFFYYFPLVQILVVVASIQMRNLKTEVEKGLMARLFHH